MKKGSDGRGTAQATEARFAGQVDYHGGQLEPGDENLDDDLTAADLEVGPRPSLADLDVLAEPGYSTGWLDSSGGSLADHPLLRGLLLELPPKGTVPAPGWLDRWFEAARSILELLYVQEAHRR
jgi:hypothetical protein